jgi:hypothetical protein
VGVATDGLDLITKNGKALKKIGFDQYIGFGWMSAEWLVYIGSQIISQMHH